MTTRTNTGRIQRALTIAAVICLALTLVAKVQKRKLVGPQRIHSSLLQEPLQTETARQPFDFPFRGETYSVRPVAAYEIWALVVSHNNPTAFYDIYHDRNSVDTRDLGVIWGENLRTSDYQKVKFKSVSFFLYWKVPRGTQFEAFSAANNHLITDSDAVRRQIARVRVNDQVHITGMLVDYTSGQTPGWWRESSTTRNDDGGGACEVLFVDELEIVRRGRHAEYAVYGAGKWLFLALLLAKAGLFIATTGRPRERKLLRRGAPPGDAPPGGAPPSDVPPSSAPPDDPDAGQNWPGSATDGQKGPPPAAPWER